MRVGVLLRAGDIADGAAQAALSLAVELSPDGAQTYLLTASAEPAYALAGSVRVGQSPDLEDPDLEQLYQAAHQLIGAAPPDLLLLPEGDLFEAIGARLAGHYGLEALRDVTEVGLAERGLRVAKGAFGGQARLTLAVSTGAVLGVRDSVAPARARGATPAQVVALGPLPPGFAQRRVLHDQTGDDLGSARVIVSGGRGLGSAEAFAGLRSFAELLGAGLGASRAAVDEGWASPLQQVGITGRKVAPDLYIAVGISGASQHLSGIAGARTVIAVNRDEKAPIFDAADVGVVADWHALWPELRRALEE